MTVRFRRKLRRSRPALSVRPVFSRPFPAMLALGLIAISGIGLAHAQGFGDPADGQRIAASICSGCHQIGIQSRDTKNDPIPSFQAIAGMPSTTMLAINVFLRTSHDVMPNIRLTEAQITDIGAYILSLRDQSPK